jgi:hypothetical protein
LAPQPLAGPVHSLPPILHNRRRNPVPSSSKAPRGLSVLLWVTGICTGVSISPSPPSRQRPGRWTFHAGRNLPDKELRYLRTVIVTAALRWGFSSELAPLPLTFQQWAGFSPYTSSFELAGTCVFDKQSPGPFLCGLKVQPRIPRHPIPGPLRLDLTGSGSSALRALWAVSRRPFSRSYGANLPSSLTEVLSLTLGYSPSLPVSVYGTVPPPAR